MEIGNHAGIDGFSRTIIYLKCSNNNRAETVFSAFTEAIDTYGLPSKLRSDLGGENMHRFMEIYDRTAFL